MSDSEIMENNNVRWLASIHDGEELYSINLDGRKLRTPARNPLVVPCKNLAWCIASEWDAQMDDKKGIQPASMPLMSLISTTIDQISTPAGLAFTRNTVMNYLPTDSALFYTHEGDRILLAKQRKMMDPILEFFAKELEIELKTTQAMTSRIEQSPEVASKIRTMVHSLDPFSLAVIQCMTMECKSLLSALAFYYKGLDLQSLKGVSRVEEEFQVEIWGVVEGGHDMDRLNNSVSLASSSLFVGLLENSVPYYASVRSVEKWKESPPEYLIETIDGDAA